MHNRVIRDRKGIFVKIIEYIQVERVHGTERTRLAEPGDSREWEWSTCQCHRGATGAPNLSEVGSATKATSYWSERRKNTNHGTREAKRQDSGDREHEGKKGGKEQEMGAVGGTKKNPVPATVTDEVVEYAKRERSAMRG